MNNKVTWGHQVEIAVSQLDGGSVAMVQAVPGPERTGKFFKCQATNEWLKYDRAKLWRSADLAGEVNSGAPGVDLAWPTNGRVRLL